ncbi:hypothetical protein GUJ93_ZPchr0001g31910 [Zizania palustris]|uniref:Uncharacterized protein n=1 Tax=Zizania palustris TaxID=103762 RepID=A0A8J5VPH7_ZIZPA|nr:hypothetical protein GUJ93_ZPchr0001g31910 [Zizania palustris]
MDVLPLLPRSVAMAVLRKLRGVADIFPVFVGSASGSARPDAVSARLEWKGACFYENGAWLEFHNDSGSKYGGGTLHIEVRADDDTVQATKKFMSTLSFFHFNP